MRRTNGTSGNTVPLRIVPERSERPEHLIQSARAKGADILDEDVARLEDFDRFGVLEPEAAAFTGGNMPARPDGQSAQSDYGIQQHG